jgi:putative transposase
MIKTNEMHFPVGMMCRLLLVSSSGYYAWKHRPPSVREQSARLLKIEINLVFDDEKGRSGAPRIARRLRDEGKPAGRHRIARIMKDNGWRAKATRKYKATTNSKHTLPIALNLLRQNFNADSPDQKWVSGITYIWTDEGWLYLAVVLDLYSRRVIGWAISERMAATLVCDALIMALWNRKMPTCVIVHSDRGSQYCSAVYQKLFRKHHLICNMSRKADCYDNDAMESWNHSFKVEAVHGERFLTRSEAKRQVFEYIEVYYNRKQLHSKLG